MLRLDRSRISISTKEIKHHVESSGADNDLIQELLDTPVPLFDNNHEMNSPSYETTPETPNTSGKYRGTTIDTPLTEVSEIPEDNTQYEMKASELRALQDSELNSTSRYCQLFDREGITDDAPYQPKSKHLSQIRIKKFFRQRLTSRFIRLMSHLHSH
jgi:hypothetical protein